MSVPKIGACHLCLCAMRLLLCCCRNIRKVARRKNKPVNTNLKQIEFLSNHNCMRKRTIFLVIVIVYLCSNPLLSFASEDMPYAVRMPFRIVRGVTNVALGWTEIFLRPFGERQSESPVEAISQGAANTLIRIGAGLTDITTFWVPDMQMLDLYPDWQGWPYLFHWS